MAAQNPVRTADFIDSVGVNVHLPYTDGAYANVNTVIGALNYLGLDNVRDWVVNDKPYPGDEGQLSYPVVAAAGVEFNFNVVSGSDIQHAVQLMHDFLVKYPGSITSIEGPNEVNNWPVNYNGQTGNAGALAFQQALFQAVNADPLLKDIPVLNLTSWPDLVGAADYANIHPYPPNGDQPLQNLQGAVSLYQQLMPGKPVMITEAGYFTLPNVGGGVDEATQAKLTLNLIFDATKLGVQQTFLYQLLDAYADPNKTDSEKHFGLFDANNAPKPVATGIHNLTTILADNGGTAESFATSAVGYSLGGQSAGVSSLALQKSSGVSQVAVWAEPDIWDEAAHKPITAATKAVTLQLDNSYATVNIYDPLVGSTPITTLHNTGSVQLAVTDHPLIVELVGAAGAPVATTPTTPTVPVSTEPTTTAPATTTPTTTTAITAAASGGALDGGSSSEVISGATGKDVVRGMDGNDTVAGAAGDDDLNGNAGADVLHGDDGNDVVLGGKGDDAVYGDAGDDAQVNGNVGNDLVFGGAGDDFVYGGQGDDVLQGDAGRDFLSGDRGEDTLTGGLGADTFAFGRGSAEDVITDFNSAQGDRIQLAPGTAYSLTSVDGNARIYLAPGEHLTLVGVSLANLGDWLA